MKKKAKRTQRNKTELKKVELRGRSTDQISIKTGAKMDIAV